MSVLSRKEIKERLKLHVSKPASMTITPLLGEEKTYLDDDSIDLRLGTHFLLPQVPPQPFFDHSESQSDQESYLQLHVPLGSYFVLPAHQTVLGATLEFIKMPFDLSGEILTKSSIARSFMVIETAPWIHPNYRGCLTLEIANVSNTAILLYPGTPIGQLILMHTTIEEAAIPRKLSGSYMGPVYPEAPKLKSARAHLEQIGVNAYRRPGHGWVRMKEMENQIRAKVSSLSQSESQNLTELAEILKRNGAFPQDSPIFDFL
jgi:dCTP deaminase